MESQSNSEKRGVHQSGATGEWFVKAITDVKNGLNIELRIQEADEHIVQLKRTLTNPWVKNSIHYQNNLDLINFCHAIRFIAKENQK